MSKFKSNDNRKSKTIALITKNINKKGKIKGSNKKETKQYKMMCPHHRITKKGKVKSTIINGGNGVCVCELCKAEIRTKFYTDEQVAEAVKNLNDIVQQFKYMSTAIGANKAVDYGAQFAVYLNHFPKSYKRVRNVARKSGNMKKKKYDNNRGGSNVYGSWNLAHKR